MITYKGNTYLKIVELSKLNKQAKNKILKGLYSGLFKMEIDIHKWSSSECRQTNVDVVLTDRKGQPDCNISHFGYNFYYRTKAGMEYRAYKSLGILLKEVKRKVREHRGTVYNVYLICGKQRIVIE